MEGLATGSLASLRERNRRSLISSLSERGMASRADLARLTGLSRSTVSSLVAEMQATGLVEERHASASGGRPGVLLALSRGAGVVVAADFGHHRLRVAVFDLAHTVLADAVHDVDIDAPADAGDADRGRRRSTTRSTAPARAWTRSSASGWACPARSAATAARWAARRSCPPGSASPVAAAMTERLGVPVLADNDANLGALAEVTFGAGRGCTRGRLPEALLGHRRRPLHGRPHLPRRQRHRRRDRPRDPRRGRPGLPLRQPRLPGDARRRAGARRRC